MPEPGPLPGHRAPICHSSSIHKSSRHAVGGGLRRRLGRQVMTGLVDVAALRVVAGVAAGDL